MSDESTITYQTGWDSSAGPPAVLLTAVVYFWSALVGSIFEILFGGFYLGGAEEADFHVATPVLGLLYVLMGIWMMSIAFGILRLQAWVFWGALLTSVGLFGLSVTQIVRFVNGTTITPEAIFFASLGVLFMGMNINFLLSGTRPVLHYRIFKGSKFTPGLALCGIALLIPTLALTLFVNHINKHLNSPVLVLIYLLGFVVMIVMAFGALKLQRWVWWGGWAWAIVLTWLSIDVILRQLTASHVDTEGIIFSAVNFLVVLEVAYYLMLDDVREAVFRDRPKQTLFSPPTLIGGLLLSVLALAIYLLPGDLGKLPVTYSVFGMVMGVVVGLLPGADPTNRLLGFVVGLLLAFASFVVRGGLLPYTNLSAAVIVTLMLLIMTAITAILRSRTWFVAMLLGVGTMYALVEPLFQAAPSGYLAEAGLAFIGILLGFGVGYAVSGFLQLELVPYKATGAQAEPALAAQVTGSSATSDKAHHDDKKKEPSSGSSATSGQASHEDKQRELSRGSKAASGKAEQDDEQGQATSGSGATAGHASHDDEQKKASA